MKASSSGNKGVFFIVGAPRSGTYLLVTRLNARFPVAIPVETHFVPLFKRYIPLWGDLAEEKNRRKLLAAIYDFLAIWTPRSERGRPWEDVYRFSLLATKGQAERIIRKSSSYEDLVSLLFDSYAHLHGMELPGDKSAFFASIELNKYVNVNRRDKVIHVIRDGRDVGLSWRKIWTGPLTLTRSAMLWRSHVLDKKHWGEIHADNYFELKYEDFISNSNAIYGDIADFLEADMVTEVGDISDIAEMLAKGDTHNKISQPLDPNNQNKWLTEMSKHEQKLFEFFAGDVLVECGYEISGSRFTTIDRVYFGLCRLGAFYREFFSCRRIRLFVKEILPLVLFVSEKLNIPVVKIVNGAK